MPDMDSDSMLGGPVDEEERWLDALEKGELDDNGELKKEVDESLLTARQVKKERRNKRSYEDDLCCVYCVLESAVTQAAEPAPPGAPHGLQGERDDRGDDAKTGRAGPEETPAGRQEGGGEQEPDDREADQNQQGQDQEHERTQVQAEPLPHDPLQRLRPGNGRILPRGGPRPRPGPSSSRALAAPRLRRGRLPQPEKVLVLKDGGPALQPGLLQEEPAAGAERSLGPNDWRSLRQDADEDADAAPTAFTTPHL